MTIEREYYTKKESFALASSPPALYGVPFSFRYAQTQNTVGFLGYDLADTNGIVTICLTLFSSTRPVSTRSKVDSTARTVGNGANNRSGYFAPVCRRRPTDRRILGTLVDRDLYVSQVLCVKGIGRLCTG